MACCQQVARCGSAAARAARAPRRARVIAAAEGAAAAPAPARRAMLSAGAALAAGAAVGVAPASAAGGYVPVKDLQDNYEFLYPQGWEEVRVQGQDKVFKDLIEPLESVSVTVLPTQTEKLTDLGDAKTVAPQFIDKVLSTPGSEFKLKDVSTREDAGHTYYTFIYEVVQNGFKRFGVSTIAIDGGKFYVLTTGAGDKRWPKVQRTLLTVADSFKNIV
eukprot:PRCOL_00000618-RA